MKQLLSLILLPYLYGFHHWPSAWKQPSYPPRSKSCFPSARCSSPSVSGCAHAPSACQATDRLFRRRHLGLHGSQTGIDAPHGRREQIPQPDGGIDDVIGHAVSPHSQRMDSAAFQAARIVYNKRKKTLRRKDDGYEAWKSRKWFHRTPFL